MATLILAEKIDAQTALSWGLAYAVEALANLAARAQDIAHRLAEGPSAVLAFIRQLQTSSFNTALPDQLRAELNAQEGALRSPECVEGVTAFFQKREPPIQSPSKRR